MSAALIAAENIEAPAAMIDATFMYVLPCVLRILLQHGLHEGGIRASVSPSPLGRRRNERRRVRPPFVPERRGRGRRRRRSGFPAEAFRSAAQGRRGRVARGVRVSQRGRGGVRRGGGGPHD